MADIKPKVEPKIEPGLPHLSGSHLTTVQGSSGSQGAVQKLPWMSGSVVKACPNINGGVQGPKDPIMSRMSGTGLHDPMERILDDLLPETVGFGGHSIYGDEDLRGLDLE